MSQIARSRSMRIRATARQIMVEACDKRYGPAFRPMQRYYKVIEKVMTHLNDDRS